MNTKPLNTKTGFLFLLALAFSVSVFGIEPTEKWDIFEISLKGPSEGNPYKDVQLSAVFSNGDHTMEIHGFYDGEGSYKIRFMPDSEGQWTYLTSSSHKELNGKKGKFTCVKNTGNNHGPVRVADKFHFAHADGFPFKPFGATCYGSFHAREEMQDKIIETLSNAPFNKARILILGFGGPQNNHCPEINVFQPDTSGGIDLTRFNPVHWENLDKRLSQLRDMGIEADVIIYNGCPESVEDFYLNYLVSRISAYRNVWWCLANEYNLDGSKTQEDWDRRGRLLAELDPYDHLLSNHNHPSKEFAWDKEYITHVSCQYDDQRFVATLRDKYQKPVINDEPQYEGDLYLHWGNISAQELVHRYWLGAVNGIYTTHGETYSNGIAAAYIGESPERIAFLRKIMEEGPDKGLEPYMQDQFWKNFAAGDINNYLLLYFGPHQPGLWYFDFPDEGKFKIDIIDPWNMTIETMEETFTGKIKVNFPVKPNMAYRARRID